MNFEKNTIRTGLLLTVTILILGATIITLGFPALFKPQKTFYVSFDNAAGITPGAPVLLAGRKIGQVTNIQSPIPPDQRPAEHPDYEVKIEMRVDGAAVIYKDVTVTMGQLGLLGSQIIDIAKGSPETGLASDNQVFIGVRQPDVTTAIPKMLDRIEPLVTQAQDTLEELQGTVKNLTALTAPDGELSASLVKIRELGDNLTTITAADGPLTLSLKNFDTLTKSLTESSGPLQMTLKNFENVSRQLSENNNLEKTLDNLRIASVQMERTLVTADSLIDGIGPDLDATLLNTRQFTDTLKRQPWRLLWPSTKTYPDGDEAAASTLELSDTERKSRSSRPWPGSQRPSSFRFRK